jgi:uroporphyrinogen decarboxylase
VSAIGLDETVDPVWATRAARSGCRSRAISIPLRLSRGRRDESAVSRILDAFAERPHIFNLGHGILQDTPIAHVEQLIALVKGDK